MVLGIGEGKIGIVTEKQNYTNGEMLKGKVTLDLNGAKKAKGLRIKFYGERRVQRGKSSHIEKIMIQEFSLDVEKEYPAGTKDYEFQFQLPTLQRPQQSQDGGIMGGIMNIISSMSDPYGNVSWFLDASLDLPMSFDISRKQRVNFVR